VIYLTHHQDLSDSEVCVMYIFAVPITGRTMFRFIS